LSKQNDRKTNRPSGTQNEGNSLVQSRGAVGQPHLGTSGSPDAATNARCIGPLRILIEPTASGTKWVARLGDRVLCIAAAPFVHSARVLLGEGYHPDKWIEMWRPNTQEWALRGRIGPIAAVLLDGETEASRAKNGSPVRETALGKSQEQPTQEVSSSGRSWRER
jgi:hypothetical protein